MTNPSPQNLPARTLNFHPLFVAFFLLVLCFASYANSLTNGFLMDDYPMLIKNQNITKPDFWHIDLSNRGAGLSYFRPVHNLITYHTYGLFGEKPTGYHLTNLMFFYLSCLAIYHLLVAVIKDKPTAFLTTALFAAHPINSIVIDYKNATYFSIFLLVMALGILQNVKNIQRPLNFFREIAALLFCAFALLSHEIAVAYPLYLAAIVYFGCGRTFKETVLRSLPSAILVGAYILFRFFFFSVKEGVLHNMHMPLLTYTASLGKAIIWYLSKLVGLQEIIMAWNATALPSEVVTFNVLFIVMIIAFGIFLQSLRRDDPRKLGVIWLIIGLMPLSVACFSRPMFGFAIQPHWMLFGSIGFFLILGTTLRQLGNTMHRTVWVFLIMIIMITYVLHTRHYNHLWGSQERYCRYWLSVSPESSWANYWLAYDRMEHNDIAEAEKYFQRAATGSFADAAIYMNLGYLKRIQGRYKEAAADYERSLRLAPNSAPSHFWLGYVQLKLNDPQKAEVCFNRALILDGSLADEIKQIKELPR